MLVGAGEAAVLTGVSTFSFRLVFSHVAPC